MSKTGLAIAGRTEGTRFPTFEVYQPKSAPWHDKPPQQADDRGLTARQTRQPVDARDHAGMNLVPHQSVIGQSFQVAVERVHGAMGEYEGILNARDSSSSCYRRVNVGSIARQYHATNQFARGDAITDMKRGLPVNRASFRPARQTRQ